MSAKYLSGIVEGFYGREWDWAARRAFADFLAAQGFNCYLYCPKSDARLRREWQRPWSADTAAALRDLAGHCRSLGLQWGIGLSPYALYQDYGPRQKRALRRKISEINDLGGELLAVLFDDMPGDCSELAARQAGILRDVQVWSNASRLLTCSSYYSYDPVLEQFFGTRPDHYWRDFGNQVPAEFDLFWTGNEVCANAISRDDLRRATAELGRVPLLWDNYPVNDGRQASRYLHLRAAPARDEGLCALSSGHLFNPMNQAWLSMLPLALHAGPGDWETTAGALYGRELAALLQRDLVLFQDQGLDAIDQAGRDSLCAEYGSLSHPAAREVCAWLGEEYRFDPACLTG